MSDMVWQFLHPKATPEHLGLLPWMLDANDADCATAQFDKNYQHGGGWRPQSGFHLNEDNSLDYPGDPPLVPIAQTNLRDELIVIYDYGYVAVIQPDRTFEACRMD